MRRKRSFNWLFRTFNVPDLLQMPISHLQCTNKTKNISPSEEKEWERARENPRKPHIAQKQKKEKWARERGSYLDRELWRKLVGENGSEIRDVGRREKNKDLKEKLLGGRFRDRVPSKENEKENLLLSKSVSENRCWTPSFNIGFFKNWRPNIISKTIWRKSSLKDYKYLQYSHHIFYDNSFSRTIVEQTLLTFLFVVVITNNVKTYT